MSIQCRREIIKAPVAHVSGDKDGSGQKEGKMSFGARQLKPRRSGTSSKALGRAMVCSRLAGHLV